MDTNIRHVLPHAVHRLRTARLAASAKFFLAREYAVAGRVVTQVLPTEAGDGRQARRQLPADMEDAAHLRLRSLRSPQIVTAGA